MHLSEIDACCTEAMCELKHHGNHGEIGKIFQTGRPHGVVFLRQVMTGGADYA
jgi:hypothetical protein